MARFIVRLWVDLDVRAEDKTEAIKIAHTSRVDVGKEANYEQYDIQVSGEVWEKEEN